LRVLDDEIKENKVDAEARCGRQIGGGEEDVRRTTASLKLRSHF
jgi:hypothetical protein